MIRDGAPSTGNARHACARLTRGRGLAIAITLRPVSRPARPDARGAAAQNTRDTADRVASNLGVSACAREVLSRHGHLRGGSVDPGEAALRLEAARCPRPRVNPARC